MRAIESSGSRRLVDIGNSGRSGVKGAGGGPVGGGAGGGGGGPRIRGIGFGSDERPAGVEDVQRGGPTQAVARERDLIGPTCFGEELVAQKDRLIERRRGGRVGDPHILLHLRLEIGVRGRELTLVVTGLGHLAALV